MNWMGDAPVTLASLHLQPLPNMHPSTLGYYSLPSPRHSFLGKDMVFMNHTYGAALIFSAQSYPHNGLC